MKIVLFSINPLYPDKVTGGASKHLYHIARHLGELGIRWKLSAPSHVTPRSLLLGVNRYMYILSCRFTFHFHNHTLSAARIWPALLKN